jgi:hypothetical protein
MKICEAARVLELNDGESHGMHEHKWNYNNNGNDWKVMYPECRTKY